MNVLLNDEHADPRTAYLIRRFIMERFPKMPGVHVRPIRHYTLEYVEAQGLDLRQEGGRQ